jgi:hypothetical protein
VLDGPPRAIAVASCHDKTRSSFAISWSEVSDHFNDQGKEQSDGWHAEVEWQSL